MSELGHMAGQRLDMYHSVVGMCARDSITASKLLNAMAAGWTGNHPVLCLILLQALVRLCLAHLLAHD